MDMEHIKLFFSLVKSACINKGRKYGSNLKTRNNVRTQIAVIFRYELHYLIILNFYDGGV